MTSIPTIDPLAAPVSMPRAGALWRAAFSLARRELVRFVRQPNRVIGALATPIVFWLLIGGGMGGSFRADNIAGGEHYITYFFPGTLAMILLFTAIFSTISIIEDRREGFLQSVLIAPVPRLAIVLGKVLGGTLLAVAQGAVFLFLAPTVGIHLSPQNVLISLGIMLLVSFSLTALGFCIAWRMNSTQGFHAIMNLLLMPMWLLSGALFPLERAWGAVRWMMLLNPLTYGLAALRRAIYWPNAIGPGLPSMTVSLVVVGAFTVAALLLAAWIARAAVSGDLH